MDKEKTKEIAKSSIQKIFNGLNNAIPDAVSFAIIEGYKQGWIECEAYYGIKHNDVQAEDDIVEIVD